MSVQTQPVATIPCRLITDYYPVSVCSLPNFPDVLTELPSTLKIESINTLHFREFYILFDHPYLWHHHSNFVIRTRPLLP